MYKLRIFFLLSIMFSFLQANEPLLISPKIALKMIDKKGVTFLALDEAKLKVKKSKIVDMKSLHSSDILGRTECSPFYVCLAEIEKYFSNLGIDNNQALVIYDNSYGINATTLYVILESMGHKNIKILRGTLDDIAKLDPNLKIYNGYLDELKMKGLNTTNLKKEEELLQKMHILKPHLLLEAYDSSNFNRQKSDYHVTKVKSDYFLSKKALKKVVKSVRSNATNTSVIDACEMIDIVGSSNGSYRLGVKSLFWKNLIDKKKKSLKSDEALEKIVLHLGLNKDEEHYIYCMSGAQKAFYVMMVLRELGYEKVKAFTGDWNMWVGDIYE